MGPIKAVQSQWALLTAPDISARCHHRSPLHQILPSSPSAPHPHRQEPTHPEGGLRCPPQGHSSCVTSFHAVYQAVSLPLYQRFVIVHLAPSLGTAAVEILHVLSRNWEKYDQSTCSNESSSSCTGGGFSQSSLPSSCAQGFPVKPNKFSSLPHSCFCKKVNPSSVFCIPHQPPLWRWALAKPGDAAAKGWTTSSLPTPEWILQPLQGAGGKERGNDVGVPIWEVSGTERPHQAAPRDGSHTSYSMQLQNLLPAPCFFLVAFVVLVHGKKIPPENCLSHSENGQTRRDDAGS